MAEQTLFFENEMGPHPVATTHLAPAAGTSEAPRTASTTITGPKVLTVGRTDRHRRPTDSQEVR
ncbi:hypothetical protein ERC79_04200 [Rhodococcus sp. ABRD24]|uniref:hypothetical protein n=1 Tax=Rhodococcus sp. ABRD24 TaxID=2507582 RepID=UPI00103EE1FC|nr:hypothetical protein [Rhodococcus sp. ABRD24]QBJ95243.1 hypothetical protein ERC79_04200 [Rhodococcus sp. ABRD24]